MFPNKKRKFRWVSIRQKAGLEGCTKERFGGLFRSPPLCAYHWPALLCSLIARPSVQSAANSCYSFWNTALHLVLSIL